MASRKEDESAQRPLPPPNSFSPPGGPVAGAPPPVLARLGLSSSAVLLGDLARPFAWLGTQLLLILQPSLSVFGAGPAVARLAQTLEQLDAPDGAPPEAEP